MAKRTQLSSPSGDQRPVEARQSARTTSRGQGSQPGMPEWAPTPQLSPWEAIALPAIRPQRPTASESGSTSSKCVASGHFRSFFASWRERQTSEGGVLHMRRMLAALSTLATLFVVAGAGWKF